MKLGQHAYPHHLDSSRPVQIKKDAIIGGKKYIYCGQFEEGTDTWDGFGILVYSDGNIYEGCWKNGSINEFGRYIYNTGDYYIGEFEEGSKHGQGTYWFANGRKYVGEYKNGQRTGQGTLWLADDSKYVGEFLNDNYHGKGTEYTADGQIFREGVWKYDKYVEKE